MPTLSILFIYITVGICNRCNVLNNSFVCACIPSLADIITHVSHFPQTIDKEIEGKCIIIYISVL